MVLSRKLAYGVVVAIALTAYVVAAYASLWVAPQALGMTTPQAFARFQGGGTFGIEIFTVAWTLWSGLCVYFILARIKRSDAWARRGRHRFISLAGSALMAFGLVGSSSWLTLMEVNLAMEHVTPWQQREGGFSALFVVLWVTALGAIVTALMLGAAGAAIDRLFGKAPLLARVRQS